MSLSVLVSSVCVPSSGIAGSYGSSVSLTDALLCTHLWYMSTYIYIASILVSQHI